MGCIKMDMTPLNFLTIFLTNNIAIITFPHFDTIEAFSTIHSLIEMIGSNTGGSENVTENMCICDIAYHFICEPKF